MAETPLNIRLKTKDGHQVMKVLTSQSTILQLKEYISKLTKISMDSMRILKGFPPVPLDLSDDDNNLEGVGVRSGDTLIVEEDSAAKRQREEKQQEALLHAYEAQNQAGGFLTRQVVPANNSCLFTSVNFVMEGKNKLDLDCAKPMRELIAGIVQSDSQTYTEAFLGRSNAEYCEWIMNDASWGGGIEVRILSDHYKIEIAVVETQHVHISRFGEDRNYTQRVLLIYDGVHYDPLVLEPVDPALPKQTKFATSNDTVLHQAEELAREAQASRQYTDVNNFTIRCLICQKAFIGQTEAQEHAKQTGHINFSEN